MMPHFRRWIFIFSIAAALSAGHSATAQAGLIPWLYDAIFGPNVPRGHYGAGYAPMGGHYGGATLAPATAYMPPRTSYMMPSSASYTMGYAASDPCAPICDPCGTGACVGGACGTSFPPATGTSAPPAVDPEIDPVPTYGDPPPSGDTAPPADDDGFGPRTNEPDEFGSEAMRPTGPLDPETTIRQRESAPTQPMKEDQQNSGEGDADPTANDAGPSLGVDKLVTWRVSPKMKRLTLKANFANPVVARRTASVNEDWVPASQQTKVVVSK